MTRRAAARSAWLFLVVGLLLLCGCAREFAARPADPLLARAAGRGAIPAGADAWIAEGARAQRGGDSARAAGLYLRALEALGPERRSAPAAVENRRFATARLVELCAPALLAGSRPLDLAGPEGRRWRVRLRRGDGPGGMEPRKFAGLVPTDRWQVTRAPSLLRVPGAGAPVMGDLPPTRPARVDLGMATPGVQDKPIEGLTWPMTVRARLGPPAPSGSAREVALEIYSPLTADAFPAAEPLAADYTTPVAVTEARQSARRAWLTAFLRADRYLGLTGIFPIEPPTPHKTPLVLVHGLLSDPGTFRTMHHALLADPEVRRHYQVWVFFYPSSLPVPFSALQLRSDLAELVGRLDPDGTNPRMHRIVLVGHSMGGILSRLVVSDGGDRYYRHFLRVPVDQLKTSAELRRLARRTFYYRASPDVRAVVFAGTPHRGSQMVLSPAGIIGRWLGRLPRQMSDDFRGIIARNPGVLAGKNRRIEGSVYLLGPHSPLVSALADMPLDARRTRIYSIIGDRGRGGPRAQSSDGVVRYQSAHLPQARRETMVPASHTGILASPEAIAEVRRILREEAGN